MPLHLSSAKSVQSIILSSRHVSIISGNSTTSLGSRYYHLPLALGKTEAQKGHWELRQTVLYTHINKDYKNYTFKVYANRCGDYEDSMLLALPMGLGRQNLYVWHYYNIRQQRALCGEL